MRSIWQKISHAFERGDLVPFAVLVSAWHFIQALHGFGEALPVAIATGIFVDMLHFRTVRQAVATRSRVAAWVAVLTTTLSYIFHWLFYAHSGGAYSFELVTFLLAAPLPLGIPILAWQQASDRRPLLVRKLQEMKADLKRAGERVNELESAVNRHEADVNRLEAAVKQRESRIKHLESDVNEHKSTVNRYESGMNNLNPLAAAVYRMVVTGEGTGKEIAQAYSVSEAKVSKIKSIMNGG